MAASSSSGVALSSCAAWPITVSSWRNRARVAVPVVASNRRRLDPIEPSDTMRTGPIWPVAATWVPPHSSVEWWPARTTRTTSPYLSPKKAMAPNRSASDLGISVASTASSARIRSLTRSSTRVISSGVMGP